MKRRWWIVPVVAVFAIAVVLFAFWDAIAVRIMPGAVLSKALINTAASMETRLEYSPLRVLARGIDRMGNNEIEFQLDTSNTLLGDVSYQMDVRTMGNPRKLNATGTVSFSGSSLNLSLYADKDFAAVSSRDLLDGRFYGITYESFHDDIRRIPLLPLLIGEKTLNEWEASVHELQAMMEKQYDFPDFSETDLRTGLMGILALKPQVSRNSISLNGQELDAYKLTFSASGQQIASMSGDYVKYMSAEVLELVRKFANDAESSLSVSFFLRDNSVVKGDMDISLEGERLQGELILGQDAARDPIKLAWIRHGEKDLEKMSVDIASEYDETHFAEVWSVVRIENGIQSRNSIDYTWDTASGDLELNTSKGAQKRSVLLNLKPAEEGFLLATQQFENLLSIFSETQKDGNSACIMTVSKGAQIVTPEYKNIDQWTGEDLLSLLGSIGALLGLQI